MFRRWQLASREAGERAHMCDDCILSSCVVYVCGLTGWLVGDTPKSGGDNGRVLPCPLLLLRSCWYHWRPSNKQQQPNNNKLYDN